MTFSPSLSDLKFEYDEYLAWFVDNGQEPLSFEEFCKEEGYSL